MKYRQPVVPQELEYLVDNSLLGVHEKHAGMTYESLLNLTRQTGLEASNPDSSSFGAVMFSHPGADFEAGVSVVASSYQQAWKPSKVASGFFFHDAANPDGVTIVLPNNSGSHRYYEFSDKELEQMDSGDLRPFFEHQMRTVEKFLGRKAIGDVRISGYSQGALVGLGMAAVGSDKFSVHKVNAFEAPSEERTPKELKYDFTKSGGPIDQVRAIRDAAIPSLSQSLRLDRLLGDYIRFGTDSTDSTSKAVMNAMSSPKIDKLVDEAIRNNDDINIILGYIAGSRMRGDAVLAKREGLSIFEIGKGFGSHRHATSDNVVANALMMSV